MSRACTAMFALVTLSLGARAGDGLKVGDERTVLADGPGGDIRGTPHVAFGKGVYLAVWREGWHGEGGSARIFAARLDGQGKVLDPKPIEVAPCKDGFQELPRVAYSPIREKGGGVFLVAWQDSGSGPSLRDGSSPAPAGRATTRNGKDCDVLGARISPEGAVIDAQPIAIATGPRTQSAPDVASDGKDFLVAWQAVQVEAASSRLPTRQDAASTGEENAYRVQAARVGADGRLGTAVEIKSPWTKAAACPKIVWDGVNYRVVFVSQSLLSIRLAPDGSLLDKDPVVTLRGNLGAAIGFSHSLAAGGEGGPSPPGKGMLAVFARSQPDYWGWGGPGAMIGLLVGMDGKADAGIPRESYPQAKLANWLDFGREKKEGSPWPYGQSAVAWDGKQFVAVWQRHHITKTVSLTNCDLIASRVDGWRPLDGEGVAVAATDLEEKAPALASDGAGKLLCVYEKHARDGKVSLVARVLETR